MARSDVTLTWKRVSGMIQAREALKARPCVFVQTDRARLPLRVGKAAHGLAAAFSHNAAEVVDAAMHRSGNRLYVATVRGPACGAVERELLWQLRGLRLYNRAKPQRAPRVRVTLRHVGRGPRFPARTRQP